MTKKLNVGLMGYGFMGRTHSNAYAKVKRKPLKGHARRLFSRKEVVL